MTDHRALIDYRHDCNGLRLAIARACDPCRYQGPDASLGYMTLDEQAVWLTRHVVRKARELGLYRDDGDVRGAA